MKNSSIKINIYYTPFYKKKVPINKLQKEKLRLGFVGFHGLDNVRISRISDSQGRTAKIFSTGSSEGNIVTLKLSIKRLEIRNDKNDILIIIKKKSSYDTQLC